MRRAHLVGSVAMIVALAACGGSADDSTTTAEPATTTASGGLEGELLVSAAASLTDAFAEVEAAFEEANPEVDVLLNLGPSSGLREAILEGAPADVFASANTSNMDQVAEAGELAGEAEIFVTNLLEIAVPAGNPGECRWTGGLRQGGVVDRALRRGRPVWRVWAAGIGERRCHSSDRHQRTGRASLADEGRER